MLLEEKLYIMPHLKALNCGKKSLQMQGCGKTFTLESGINVPTGINVPLGKFGQNNKHTHWNKRTPWKFDMIMN